MGCFFFPLFAAPVFYLLFLLQHAVDCIDLSAPKEVVGTYGGSVKVTCQYNLRFKNYTKYWCKGRSYDFCRIVVKTPRNRWSDRSSIADDRTAGAFTITTTVLRDSDDDVYWCVIATSGKNVNARVRLRISHTGMTHMGNPTLEKHQLHIYLIPPFMHSIWQPVLRVKRTFYFNYFYINNVAHQIGPKVSYKKGISKKWNLSIKKPFNITNNNTLIHMIIINTRVKNLWLTYA